MFKSRTILALAVAGVLVAGCKPEEKTVPSTTTPPAAPTAPATPAATTPAAPAIPAMPAMPAVPSTTQPADSAAPAVPAIPAAPSVTPPAAPATPSTPSASTTDDAKAIIAQAESDVAAKKWTEAGQDIKKLAALKDQLTPDQKDKLAALEKQVTEGLSGIKIPSGIPGLGGGDNK